VKRELLFPSRLQMAIELLEDAEHASMSSDRARTILAFDAAYLVAAEVAAKHGFVASPIERDDCPIAAALEAGLRALELPADDLRFGRAFLNWARNRYEEPVRPPPAGVDVAMAWSKRLVGAAQRWLGAR
jgi:hypothetical protein